MNPLRSPKPIIALLCLSLSAVWALAQDAPTLLEVRKIWDAAPHNAFTDLERFQGDLYCAFREGKAHVSPDGAIRILRSPNAAKWSSASRVTHPQGDLRDPKLSVTPGNQLMLLAALALREGNETSHRTFTWFSDDGESWSDPTEVGEKDVWLWRAEWQKGKSYALGYSTDQRHFVRLYQGDGKNFQVLVPELFSKAKHGKGYPNETALVFSPDGAAWCLLRRDADSNTAQLGKSTPPYQHWEWLDSAVRIGGPAMIQLPDGRLLAAVRLYDGGPRTSLAWVDKKTGQLDECLKLPSGGDTSYPGLVLARDTLYVSYYSSHEGKTSIYLAKVRF